MKKVVHVDPEQFAAIRLAALEEEIAGIDPGAYWAGRYPGATEIEFVVIPDGQPPQLKVGVHPRDEMEDPRTVGYAPDRPWPWPMCKGCGNEPNACVCDTQNGAGEQL